MNYVRVAVALAAALFAFAPAILSAQPPGSVDPSQTFRAKTVTALALLPSARFTDGDIVIVEDERRGGSFVWDTADLSTECGYDDDATWKGIYFKPDAEADCTNGAWVRADYLANKAIQIEWFGAIAGDGADDDAAFQAAIDFIDAAGSSGAFNNPSKTIRAGAGQYDFGAGITIPGSADGLKLIGAGRKSTVFATDDNIDIINVGADLSGGGDTASSDASFFIEIRGVKFRDTAPTGASVAIQMNRTPYSVIADNSFVDFQIAIEGHRFNFSEVLNNMFVLSSRVDTDPAIAHIRLQGVFDSGNSYTPGGNLYFTDNEFLGHPTDQNALSAAIEIKTVDGLFLRGGHFNQYVRAIKLSPDASTINNKILDVRVHDVYFDGGVDAGSVAIEIGGTVTLSGGLYQDIIFDNIKCRGGSAATRCITVDVTGAGGFDGLKNIRLMNSQLKQFTSTAINVNGVGESRIEVDGFDILNTVFQENNTAGGLANASFNIEAKSVTISDNTFLADDNAATRIGSVDVSGSAASVICGNNITQANYSGDEPFNVNYGAGSMVTYCADSAKEQHRFVRGVFTGAADGDEAVILFRTDFPGDNLSGQLFANVVGHSTNTASHFIAHRVRAVVVRNDAGALTEYAATVENTNGNVGNNNCEVIAKLLTGTAYSNGMSVADCDVVVNGGNAYLVTDEGDGTATDATGPVGATPGSEVVDDVRFSYLGAEDTDRLALIASGTGTNPMTWSASVDFIRN